jgi:tRNA threonylcarbamoyladenosine biosynthesis protein TsaB
LADRVLAIETSSPTASLALLEGDEVRAWRCNTEAHTHAERLLGLLGECMQSAGWQRTDLQKVCVGVGPGSFTGLRVGIALAQGLALGLGLPLVGVPSLAALARAGAGVSAADVLCPIVDAHRGEFFAAAYTANGEELWPARTFALEGGGAELKELLGSRSFMGVGVMAERILGVEQSVRSERCSGPDAEFVARLGIALPASVEVVPLYARGANAVVPKLPPNPLARSSAEH